MLHVLLVLALSAGAVQSLSCPTNEYYSPNGKACVPAKKSGGYCNIIQFCMTGLECKSNKCVSMESEFVYLDDEGKCHAKQDAGHTLQGAAWRSPPVYRSADGVLEVELTMDIYPYEDQFYSCPFGMYMFNGQFPAPTLILNPGDKLRVHLVNALTKDKDIPRNHLENMFTYPNRTNLHVHGLHVSALLPGDDVFMYLEGGESYQYEYEIPEDHMPGHHWYHPHHHGSSSLQVGMAFGNIIIEKKPGTDGSGFLPFPHPLKQLRKEQISLSHGNFGNNKNFGSYNTLLTAYEQPELTKMVCESTTTPAKFAYKLVNGQYKPDLRMVAGEPLQLDILVADWTLESFLRVESTKETTKCTMHLMSKDGIPLYDAPRPVTWLNMPSGSRAGVIFLCANPGRSRLYDIKQADDVLYFNVLPSSPAMKSKPTYATAETVNALSPLPVKWPRYLTDLRSVEPDYRHEVQMNINADICAPPPNCYRTNQYVDNIEDFPWQVNQTVPSSISAFKPFYHTVNRRLFDHHSIATFPGESIVETTFLGPQTHPYHQHTNPFQISELFDDPLNPNDEWYQGWYKVGDWHDLIVINPFELLNNFHTYTNPWPQMKWKWGAYDFYPHEGEDDEPMVFHCHKLWHEDAGMMGYYKIGPVGSEPGPNPIVTRPDGYLGDWTGEIVFDNWRAELPLRPFDCILNGVSVDHSECDDEQEQQNDATIEL